jgi:hypothetical protein
MARVRSRLRSAAIVIGSVAIILLAAAIIVPNVFRSRITDGGPVGARTVRMLATAQVSYSSTYPDQGYAPNLAALGPDRPDLTIDCRPTPAHGCLIDSKIGCSSGKGLGWCADRVYRYNMQSSYSAPPYENYWVTATPLKADPENKNYCSTSEAVVRSETGPPLSRPYTLEECEKLQIDSSAYRPP